MMLIKTCKIEINHRFVIYRKYEPTFSAMLSSGDLFAAVYAARLLKEKIIFHPFKLGSDLNNFSFLKYARL
jgi:hypothetical protein